MKILHKAGNIVEYPHVIAPIFNGIEFVPNVQKLESVRSTAKCNILTESFEREQLEGNTILINENGGWCILTKSMMVLVTPTKFENLNKMQILSLFN